ncbi:cytochrome P450 [Actinomadura sp. KC06]|uniref:cytochrome P450 n=1 Tax=Actinomadura sp. KC06 TaxID=2530369 RepID=UPI00140551D5|nr:cytochrome P450 [Actinomadura sp. KC06]
MGREADGRIVRANLGPFRPYLITHPDHLQHVLRDNVDNYRRDGMMWKPLSRLVGETSDADPSWPVKRRVYQDLLSGPSTALVADKMVATISDAVGELGERADPERPVDAYEEMTRIVYRTIIRVLIGDRISVSQIDELGQVMVTATTSSFRSRMLMPFVPLSVPLPGDRTFNRSVQAVDDLIFPIVREARRNGAGGRDVVSLLLNARGEDGKGIDDRAVRDGITGLFVAATDTTVSVLTFLWAALDLNPEVRARLYDEMDRVVGEGPPSFEHVADLTYTKMVLHEALRLYSVAWIAPRVVEADDLIDGVRIKAGAIVAVSPFLTHRLPGIWPQPYVFDPERFATGRSRHRFAFMAFGGGPNQCAGRVFFFIEAPLILATLLSKYRPILHSPHPVEPRVDITLKPRDRVKITLEPVRR